MYLLVFLLRVYLLYLLWANCIYFEGVFTLYSYTLSTVVYIISIIRFYSYSSWFNVREIIFEIMFMREFVCEIMLPTVVCEIFTANRECYSGRFGFELIFDWVWDYLLFKYLTFLCDVYLRLHRTDYCTGIRSRIDIFHRIVFVRSCWKKGNVGDSFTKMATTCTSRLTPAWTSTLRVASSILGNYAATARDCTAANHGWHHTKQVDGLPENATTGTFSTIEISWPFIIILEL